MISVKIMHKKRTREKTYFSYKQKKPFVFFRIKKKKEMHTFIR